MVRNESGINFSGETYVRFTDSYGKTSDGSDELIKKGFRYYLINFGDGLTADLYIHHMDAETDDKSNAARESNVKQVIKYPNYILYSTKTYSLKIFLILEIKC